MRATLWLLLSLLTISVLQIQLGAEPRWPRFRGPEGTGQYTGDLPVKWGQDDVLWRTELAGQGHSSPCVWEEKIFLTCSRKMEDRQVERLVICLNRATGEVTWQQTASIGKAEVTHGMNGFASATCASDGQRVVAFFGAGGIHCFDMDGRKLWSRDLGGFPGPWGVAASPIIVGDKVLQNCDAQGESFLMALDKEDGKTLWKTIRGTMPRGGWSTPILIDLPSRKELIVNGEFGTHGYSPDTGKEYWFCKGFSGRGTPSPIFDGDLLYIISAKPGDTFALRPGGSGDVTETHMVWHAPRSGGRNLSSPILVGQYLLTVTMNGTTTCYDVQAGKELWSERLPGNITASPIAAGGLVYFVNEAGETLVIKPGSELDIVAHNKIETANRETFRSCLVPVEGQILCRSDRALYCIGNQAADQGHPKVALSNGVVDMDLYLPDPEKGYYRGSRFDWSGVVFSLRFKGHEFFGEWQDSDDSTLHDRICGPVESFQTDGLPLGYNEARVGEGFVKIGIGVLAKPEENQYRWNGYYQMLDPGQWTIKHEQDWIEFRHVLAGPRGLSYAYTKRIQLTSNPPGFTIDHLLENTGTEVIETDQYNHNFFVIDSQPSGPDFIMRFPFPLKAIHDLKGLAKINGNEFTYLKVMDEQYIFTGLEGFGAEVKDHEFAVENRKAGVGVRVAVDRPLYKLNFWTIRTTLCPENFIYLRIPPGAQERWVSRYSLYTLGS